MSSDELFTLVRNGSLSLLQDKFLLSDLEFKGSNDQSLLHEAISFSKNEIAYFLIGCNININTVCKKKQTALHYSAIYKNLDIATALVSKGADINLIDIYGNSPAWYAALSAGNPNSLAIFKLLKANGADIKRKNFAGRSIHDVYPQA